MNDCPSLTFGDYVWHRGRIDAARLHRVHVIHQRPGTMGKSSPGVRHNQNIGCDLSVVWLEPGFNKRLHAETSSPFQARSVSTSTVLPPVTTSSAKLTVSQ